MARKQFALHRTGDRQQQLAHTQHCIADRRALHIQPRIALQSCTLPIDWERVRILGNNKVDDDLIREQRLRDDPLRRCCRFDALFRAASAGPLLALENRDEVLRRMNVEHLGFFVADHRGRFAALTAAALFSRAGDDLLGTFQMGRQRLTAGMLAPRLAARDHSVAGALGQCFAFAVGRNFFARYARLMIQQLQELSVCRIRCRWRTRRRILRPARLGQSQRAGSRSLPL